MITGWTRTCPRCGRSDGANVRRIAFYPTFKCGCGYIWDGSSARFVGAFNVGAATSNQERARLADRIAVRMEVAAANDIGVA